MPYSTDTNAQINLLSWAIEHGVQEFNLEPFWKKIFQLAKMAVIAKSRRLETMEVKSEANSKLATTPYGFGVNLSGHFSNQKSETAFALTSQMCISSLEVPLAINNVTVTAKDSLFKLGHLDFVESNPFNINLVHVNPWNLQNFLDKKGNGYFQMRHNIAFWNWDMVDFPEHSKKWFSYFDEIWVPSRFLQESLFEVSPIPVVRVPYFLKKPSASKISATENLNLKENEYVFFSNLDFSDFWIRKNPENLIKSFKKVFNKKDKASLVIQVSHPELFPAELSKFKQLASGAKVHFTHESFLSQADCYISLHQSEGHGLDILKAMSLGKPVISTSYGGHLDFANEGNSFLISHSQSKLSADFGPYKKGSRWVDPNLADACEKMRSVFKNREKAINIGLKGASDVLALQDLSSIKQLYEQRLSRLQQI